MYWYGWTATTLIAGTVVGFLATLLPESVTRKIPLTLVWLLPILAIPSGLYADAVVVPPVGPASAMPAVHGTA